MPSTTPSPDLDSIVRRQREFFDGGGTRSLAERCDLLGRVERKLEESCDTLLSVLERELSKPNVEAFVSEYFFLLQEVRMMRKSLKGWLKPEKVSTPLYFKPGKSYISREPFGVTLVIAPWNYPIQLALSPVISAVAAGNTVVLKPSEISSASEKWLADFVAKCFSPEQVAVVTGDAEVSAAVLERPFDFIFFTGSTRIGKIVAEKAAQRLTPTVLELGGKCPCVVDASADLGLAAKRLMAGKFFNGGQTCFAPDFVAVEAKVKNRFVAECEKLFASVPWNEEMARVIHRESYDRLQGLVDGRRIRQGEDDAENLRMAPVILPDATWDDAAMKEEVFGPVLPVVTFEGVDELIAKLKGYSSPLALYCFSSDDAFVEAIRFGVRSGGLCVNDTMKQSSNLALPFGGVGDSGHGRYRGRRGVYTFCYERAVMRRPMWKIDPFAMMPPYAGKMKWLRRLMK